MHQEHAETRPDLQPVFCLTYRGLSADADRQKLGRLFAKLLRLPESAAREALAAPPLQLTCDPDRDKIRTHQLGLARIGCIASIDESWTYRQWTIPGKLAASFEQPGAPRRLFALLQCQPAPGFGRLLELRRRLRSVGGCALNHAELLLECTGEPPGGAGAWLRQLREQLLPVLRGWHPDSRLEASLALCPQDGEHAQDLLDTLQQRLADAPTRAAPPIADAPDWPLAGRLWPLLWSLPANGLERAAIDADTRDWLRARWPLGIAAGGTGDAALLPQWLAQYAEQRPARQRLCDALLDCFSSLDRLPSLPAVAMKVCQLARDPDSEAEELTRTVEQDPSLSTRLLTIVNSAYFGLRARVDSIAHALVILGREEVAHLALLVSGETVFRGLKSEAGERLWRHSARTAEIARLLARKRGHANLPALYTAALLHDVGKIFLLGFAEPRCREIAEKARRHALPVFELERETFGHDHATLGAAMLRRWGLPETICACVETHHGALPGQNSLHPDAALIGLADHIAHRLDDDERWADRSRLHQQQLQALRSLPGTQDYESIDLLGEDLRGQLRELS